MSLSVMDEQCAYMNRFQKWIGSRGGVVRQALEDDIQWLGRPKLVELWTWCGKVELPCDWGEESIILIDGARMLVPSRCLFVCRRDDESAEAYSRRCQATAKNVETRFNNRVRCEYAPKTMYYGSIIAFAN